MTKGIIGKKLGMTQIFNEKGQVVPVTVIQAGPCVVVMRKTVARDGYEAVQVGFVDPQGGKRASKPEKGHCEKHGVAPVRVLRELKIEASRPPQGRRQHPGWPVRGEEQDPRHRHQQGQGLRRRHEAAPLRGGRASHGSMFHRAPGSIGASSYPSRVWPGIRMGGQMGNEQVTVRNLEIAKVDAENNLLLIKGAVPGPKGGYVVIKQEA